MKYISRSKSTAVKDIDIYIADILGQKYRYRVDIGHGDVNPPLLWMISWQYFICDRSSFEPYSKFGN